MVPAATEEAPAVTEAVRITAEVWEVHGTRTWEECIIIPITDPITDPITEDMDAADALCPW